MKKIIVTLAAIAILMCTLVFTVSAADYEYIADDLNSLSLFRGTDSGYDLDRAPTRAEGLAMLIRLLGLDEEALACKSGQPFSDVSGWALPYVAYAYENNLAKGTSDTTFSPNALCSAQMYVTYILRALGYSDAEGGDFTYADAVNFAKSIGIIDDVLTNSDFFRDQMVVVSYLALLATPNGGEFDTLLDKLVAGGAVTQEAATAFAGKLALIQELKAAASDLLKAPSFAANAKISTNMGAVGAILAAMGMDANISVDLDMSLIRGDDLKAAVNLVISMAGDDKEIHAYMVDGDIYIDNNGDKQKVGLISTDGEEPDTASLPIEVKGILALADIGQLSQLKFLPYIISGIEKAAAGDLTVYTISLADSIADAASDLVSGLGLIGDIGLGGAAPAGIDLANLDFTFNVSKIEFTVDKSGALKQVSIEAAVSTTIDTGALSIPVTVKISIEAEITAVGDAVTVDLPDDLDDYGLHYYDTAGVPLG